MCILNVFLADDRDPIIYEHFAKMICRDKSSEVRLSFSERNLSRSRQNYQLHLSAIMCLLLVCVQLQVRRTVVECMSVTQGTLPHLLNRTLDTNADVSLFALSVHSFDS